MKVSHAIEILTNDFKPDDNICILVYDKKMFDYSEDDEMELTDDGWRNVVNDFEKLEFNDIWESLSMAVLDYAIERED